MSEPDGPRRGRGRDDAGTTRRRDMSTAGPAEEPEPSGGATGDRDRDDAGRPRQARPRDALGRPLPYGDDRAVDPVPEQPLPPLAALALAQSLLDRGRPFAAHEVLEAVWKAAPAGERDLWQGLAQVCVGITHALRGNAVGATRLLRRGADRLRRYQGEPPHQVAVAAVLAWCDAGDGTAPPPRLRVDAPPPVTTSAAGDDL